MFIVRFCCSLLVSHSVLLLVCCLGFVVVYLFTVCCCLSVVDWSLSFDIAGLLLSFVVCCMLYVVVLFAMLN